MFSSTNMYKEGLALMVILIGYSSAQDANCDFSQNVQTGQTYYVYSPNYPNSYPGGVQCRWIATCPTGYNCRLSCSEINLPQSSGCSLDRLLISKTGDPQLIAADQYCGQGTLEVVSTAQKLSIALITSTATTGGRFLCSLTAQPQTTTPTVCRCGYKKTNRIVGGQETGVNEFPPMAGIVDSRIYQIKCGGVIISKRHVLTAAHCLRALPAATTAVVVGEHDVTIGDSPSTQGILVSQYIIHPQYSASTYDYDVGIIVLQKDIVFDDRVGPVCLPFKFLNTDMTGRNLTVLGWGTLFPGGPTSNVLLKADVKVISQSSCSAFSSTLTNRQICTYTPGKDSCQDDSGGPLLYTDPATGLLFNMGIVSSGQFCASQQPGINTRVTALLNWITTNAPTDYCVK